MSVQSMRIDGKAIAEEIIENLSQKVKKSERTLMLALVYAGDDPVIENFIRIKKNAGERIGVAFELARFPDSVSTEELVSAISKLNEREEISGIVVQLPLPSHIDKEKVLDSVVPEKDIDVLSTLAFKNFEEGRGKLVPPTAAAVSEVLSRSGVLLSGRKIALVGQGMLVGRPILAWLKRGGLEASVVTHKTANMEEVLRSADVIISGAGTPHFIKPEMVQIGAVLIDAGTSEQAGKVVGDFDPACEAKASIFTPVPGGVGPITVAALFRNLLSIL